MSGSNVVAAAAAVLHRNCCSSASTRRWKKTTVEVESPDYRLNVAVARANCSNRTVWMWTTRNTTPFSYVTNSIVFLLIWWANVRIRIFLTGQSRCCTNLMFLTSPVQSH